MKKLTFGKIKLFIIAGVGAYTVITLVSQHSLLAEQTARKAELEEKRDTVQREIDFRKNELEFIGSDEYIEQQARMRLGWLYPDEVKFIESEDAEAGDIVFPPDPTPTPSESPAPEESAPHQTGEAPEGASAPQNSQQSENTAAPEDTEKPENTPAPQDTQAPGASAQASDTPSE